MVRHRKRLRETERDREESRCIQSIYENFVSAFHEGSQPLQPVFSVPQTQVSSASTGSFILSLICSFFSFWSIQINPTIMPCLEGWGAGLRVGLSKSTHIRIHRTKHVSERRKNDREARCPLSMIMRPLYHQPFLKTR